MINNFHTLVIENPNCTAYKANNINKIIMWSGDILHKMEVCNIHLNIVTTTYKYPIK